MKEMVKINWWQQNKGKVCLVFLIMLVFILLVFFLLVGDINYSEQMFLVS